MQKDFETIVLEVYSPFIHKQARAYHNRYSSCSRYGVIDYDEFYQEAALGFLEAIRSANAKELPLPPRVFPYARQYIQNKIFYNLILSYDGIHRTPPSHVGNTAPFKILSSISTDEVPQPDIQVQAMHLNEVDLFATLNALAPAQATVAVCLINGISRREMVRRHILPRRTIDQAINCLRVIFA